MENASKAILIAGGIIIALILMTIALNIWDIGIGTFASMDQKRVIALKEEEMIKFSQFVGEVYGSEVENCIRRVNNYNYFNYTDIKVVVNNTDTGDELPEVYGKTTRIINNNGEIKHCLTSQRRNDIYQGSMITNRDGTINMMEFTCIVPK